MQTTIDLKHPRSGTVAPRPGLTSAAVLVALGVAASFGALALSASRSSVEREATSLIARCDQVSIAASDHLLMYDDPDATKATVRTERQRAFNECLEEAAIRGATAP